LFYVRIIEHDIDADVPYFNGRGVPQGRALYNSF